MMRRGWRPPPEFQSCDVFRLSFCERGGEGGHACRSYGRGDLEEVAATIVGNPEVSAGIDREAGGVGVGDGEGGASIQHGEGAGHVGGNTVCDRGRGDEDRSAVAVRR